MESQDSTLTPEAGGGADTATVETSPTASPEIPDGEFPNSAFAQSWEQTDSLLALRELIDVGCQVAPAVARRAELSHHELQALEIVMDGSVGPAEIARELGVTSAAASGIVDRLAARGHVQRRPHASDGRRTQVVITATGREEVIGYLMPMFGALARLDSALSEGERDVVARYLRGAIEAMRGLL